MARFRFRLEAPLRLARARRGALRRDMAIALRNLLLAEMTLADARSRVRAAGEAIATQTATGIDGARLAQLAALHESAARAVPPLATHVQRLAAQQEQLRVQLARVAREVETLGRLEREAHRAHALEESKRHEAAIDDVLLVRRARSMARKDEG